MQRLSLSHWQLLVLILLIANFWYSGVLLVSNISYYYEWSLFTVAILSALSYPVAVISIRGVNWVLRLTPQQSHQTVTIVTLAVTVMHIIALYTVSTWYQVSGPEIIFAAGWLSFFSITVLLASKRQFKVTPL